MYRSRTRKQNKKPKRAPRSSRKSDTISTSFNEFDRLPQTVMPRSTDKQLRVSFIKSVTGSASYSGIWLVNSAKDPFVADAAKQPVYFDQLAAIYNNYTVTRCDYRITQISGVVTPNWFAVAPNTSNSLPATGLDDFSAYPESRIAISGGMATSGTVPVPVLSGSLDVVKWLSYKSRDALIDGNFSAVTDDPTDQLYLLFNAKSTDGSTVIACKYLVELNLHIHFDNLKQVIDA